MNKSGYIPIKYKYASMSTRRTFVEMFMTYYGEENTLMMRCPKLMSDLIYLYSSIGIKIIIHSGIYLDYIAIVDDNIINKISIVKLKKD